MKLTNSYIPTYIYIFACSLDLRSPQIHPYTHLCLLIWHLTFSWSPQIHPYTHIFACSIRIVTSLWNPQIHPYTQFYLLTRNLNVLLWSSQVHPYIYTYIHIYTHLCLLIWHLTFSWSPQIHPYTHIFACSLKTWLNNKSRQKDYHDKFFLFSSTCKLSSTLLLEDIIHQANII